MMRWLSLFSMLFILAGCVSYVEVPETVEEESEEPIPHLSIESIDSLITSFETGGETLKGVTFLFNLRTDVKLNQEAFPNFSFTLTPVPGSTLESSNVTHKYYTMKKNLEDGEYLYEVQFSTIYNNNRTEEELDEILKERDFTLYFNYKDQPYVIPNKVTATP